MTDETRDSRQSRYWPFPGEFPRTNSNPPGPTVRRAFFEEVADKLERTTAENDRLKVTVGELRRDLGEARKAISKVGRKLKEERALAEFQRKFWQEENEHLRKRLAGALFQNQKNSAE